LDSAPLTLLFDVDAARVAEQLHRLLEDRGWQDPANPAVLGVRDFNIVTQALSMRASLRTQVPDLTDYNRVFLSGDGGKIQSVLTVRFDHHLPGAQYVPLVVRGYLELCAALAGGLKALIVAWHPSRTQIEAGYFAEAVSAYANGGAFPVLALINFTLNDEPQTVRTGGLGWFSGQEIDLTDPADALSKSELMRRAVRLVHDLAVNGPVTAPLILVDLDPGFQIILTPEPTGAVVHAQIEQG
jgi:hypothetical protein